MTFLNENGGAFSDELSTLTIGKPQDWWKPLKAEPVGIQAQTLLELSSDKQTLLQAEDVVSSMLGVQSTGRAVDGLLEGISTRVSAAPSKENRALLIEDVNDIDPITGGSLSAALVTEAPAYPGYMLRYEPGIALESRPAVAQWQSQMQQRGWAIEVDGLYGLASKQVAIAFQKEKGLAADGVVGPQTWQAAFDGSTITPVEPEPAPVTASVPYPGRQLSYSPLTPIRFDTQAQQVQQRLQNLGWQIEADGLFGRKSAIAIEQFQKQVNLDSDGIVGPLTWAVLFSDKAPAAPVEQDFNRPSASGRINSAGLDLIKSFEGLRLNAYQDAVGVWTIGYGHTSTAYPGQSITTAQATALLRQDVANFENAVTRAVRVPITENQFAALVSFAYNVGSGALNSSTLLRKLNAGDTFGAANEFLRWNRAGGRVLAGLTRRREAERSLFLS